MSQRRQGLLRALLFVAGFGGSLLALPFIWGGIDARMKGNDRGNALIVFGGALLLASILTTVLVHRRWGAALAATHHPSAVLPFGAKARGDGVTLRPRAAVRVTPILLIPMMLLVALGMSLDDVNPIAPIVVLALTVIVTAVWLVEMRRYEICLDRTGIWRRRRPRRWRLAWQDLERTYTVPDKRPQYEDDLVLQGLVARPRGAAKRTVRLRMNLLAISLTDLQRLIDFYGRQSSFGRQPGLTVESPFDTWS